MNWNFLSPEPTEHEVSGQIIKFYPFSVTNFVRLKTVLSPIANALNVFFQDRTNDKGSMVRDFNDTVSGEVGSEIRTEASNVDVLRFRQIESENAVQGLVDVISEDKNLAAIGFAILDSAREVCKDLYGNENPTEANGIDFARKIDLPSMKDFLVGLLKANKRTFGPLADKISSLVSAMGEEIESKIENIQSSNSSQMKISGPDSKTE